MPFGSRIERATDQLRKTLPMGFAQLVTIAGGYLGAQCDPSRAEAAAQKPKANSRQRWIWLSKSGSIQRLLNSVHMNISYQEANCNNYFLAGTKVYAEQPRGRPFHAR